MVPAVTKTCNRYQVGAIIKYNAAMAIAAHLASSLSHGKLEKLWTHCIHRKKTKIKYFTKLQFVVTKYYMIFIAKF